MSIDGLFTGTFEYVVEKFSKMGFEKEMYSMPYTIGKLSWRIMVVKTLKNSNVVPFLGAFLYTKCNDDLKNASWKCSANVSLHLLSLKENTEDRCWPFKTFFDSKNIGWGTNELIEWEVVLNQSNGYIKNDRIVVRAHIEFSFPADASPYDNQSLDSHSTNTNSRNKLTDKNTTTKIAEIEKKIEFLEAELSQLKIDLTSERCSSKKISQELKTESSEFKSSVGAMEEKIASLEGLLNAKRLINVMTEKSITERMCEKSKTTSVDFGSSSSAMEEKIVSLEELLKTEKLETSKKLDDFRRSQLRTDFMILNEKNNNEKISAKFASSLDGMERKIASLEEMLITEKLEIAKKIKHLDAQLEKEKLIVEKYQDLFRKILL